MSDEPKVESAYKIGAVSRLTGVPADTLRVWERRYGVVSPHRTDGGNRLYSESDIDRLSVIKLLVDNGHAIGTVANLSIEQLQERIENTQLGAVRNVQRRQSGPLKLTVAGATLAYRVETELEGDDTGVVEIVGSYPGIAQLEAAAAGSQPDILVLEYPTLSTGTAAEVRRLQHRCGAARVLVVYGFGIRDWVRSLEERGIATLRFPVSWDTIRRICCAEDNGEPVYHADEEGRLPVTGPVPRRRFDDAQLARVSNASVAIKCECPHHLADLVMSLSRFEQYSIECENLTSDDAALHAYLHKTTAHARSIMEESLVRLIELEGIDIERLPNAGD